jgi:hypothetical protein
MNATTGLVGAARPVSSYVVFAGLFTSSWARFGNFEVAGFNVRLPILCFALALVLMLVDCLLLHKKVFVASRVGVWVAGVLLVYLGGTVVAANHLAALGQWGTVVLGAVLPMSVIVLSASLHHNQIEMLNAFIRGGYFASAFGLYQLAAFYTGLPQGVVYTDTSGGFGRISAFSYEAAYFGYFLLLVIAAMLARAFAMRRRVPPVPLIVLLGVLLLANSRATLLALPLFLVLLYGRLPSRVVRLRIAAAVTVGAWALVVVLLLNPSTASALVARVGSLFDPNEASSNAPRLALYSTSLDILRERWLVGIGPGQLIDWLPRFGYLPIPGSTSNSVIANNVWLQAALDGGIVLVIAQIGFVVAVVRRAYFTALPAARVLSAGWLSVLIIAGLLTSFFFDTSLWVGAALALVLAQRREGDSLEVASPPSVERAGVGGTEQTPLVLPLAQDQSSSTSRPLRAGDREGHRERT